MPASSTPAVPLAEGTGRASPIGTLVASDWPTAALTMPLLVGEELSFAGGLVGLGVEELRWRRTVRRGGLLRVKSEVLGVGRSQLRPDRAVARVRNRTLKEERPPVMVQVVAMIVRRHPA